jgi:predicted RNA binding protein YcfA (HicA-like mRNA interferase family)
MVSPVKERVLIKRLRSLGFEGPFNGVKGRRNDAHPRMVRDGKEIHIPHGHGMKNGEISVQLVKEILKQGGISQEDWDARA